MTHTLTVRPESWPLAKPFTISRGTKTTAEVVVVEITDDGGNRGRAECVPYARYGESVASVLEQIKQHTPLIEGGISPPDLMQVMVAGAARNALDCALWDLWAKRTKQPVWKAMAMAKPHPVMTAETISMGSIEEITAAAAALKDAPLLKVKLDADKVVTRMAAIRDAAPSARLIIDANEAWSFDVLQEVVPPLADLGVEMIEQPLPVSADHVLAGFESPVMLCADESCHAVQNLPDLKECYAIINIKLDKTGGLTAARDLAEAARKAGLEIMVGCMVGTSLAMAPATLLGPCARFVDLDGPLLMKTDREDGLVFEKGMVSPPRPALWG